MAKRKRKGRAATISACGGPMDGVLAKGLRHPLRAEILAFLNDEQDIASPVEMFRANVGQNGQGTKYVLENISYHCRVLEELGLIVEVDSRSVRGTVEHFYEATARMMLDIEEWSKLPPEAKSEVSTAAVEETLARAGKALSAGTIDSFDERAIINLPLTLDDEGFIQLAEDVTELMILAERRQAESVQRQKGNEKKLFYASASLLLYESPPPRKAAKKKPNRSSPPKKKKKGD
jgi:DNA-binding transcriptional ArsR family regulator